MNEKLEKQLYDAQFQVGYQAKEIAELRAALEAVHWTDDCCTQQFICMWCKGIRKPDGSGDKPDCLRQAALGEEDNG